MAGMLGHWDGPLQAASAGIWVMSFDVFMYQRYGYFNEQRCKVDGNPLIPWHRSHVGHVCYSRGGSLRH